MSTRTDARPDARRPQAPTRGPLARLGPILPRTVDRRVRFLGWLSLVWQIVLVGTGGAVRLTGSGLGCPTWPRCTADSLTNTPAMGVHGIIEFANRTLTGVLLLVVIATFLAVLRLRRDRPELFWLAFALGVGIPVQAVIGGISVLVKLNPYIVGLHFVVSMMLVATAAVLVARIRAVPGPRTRAVPGWFASTGWVLAGFVALTVLLGILTTGSGPHAGDANTPRNGLNPGTLQHLHSIPAYVTAGLTLLLAGASLGLGIAALTRALAVLVAVEVVQVCVGLLQANLGLPAGLVITHMVLASLLVAATVGVLARLRRPAAV